MPFLADGIRAGQKCICVLESLAPADVLVKLDRQVDLDRTVQSGQLELATPADAYLRSGIFSTDAMLSYWQHAAAAAQGAKGSGMLRATGEMPSVLDHPDGRTEFFRYEARLNGCIASGRAGRPGRQGGIIAGATAARRDPAGRRRGVLGSAPGHWRCACRRRPAAPTG
jgi:MEDS: MEthanogen/methylotroph, DcmR Sensory domain